MTKISHSESWRLTAGELTAAYRDKHLDPVEAVRACLARLGRVNEALNAVVASDCDGALKAAEASRIRWARGVPLGRLDGIPFTVKDNLFVRGLTATWGSLAFEDFVPDDDALPVRKLREAGAIFVGKTNTPEFALASHTDNLIFGSTGNPWAPELSPGGSSGGAAAAVMAGIAPIALGTDAGGSTRRPSGHCGCVGLRTSIGAIPHRHCFPPLAADFQTVGLLARSTADARLALDCLGILPDPASEPGNDVSFAAICEIGNHPVDIEVASSFRTFVKTLRDLDMTVAKAEPPFDSDAVGELFLDIASAGVARVVEDLNGRTRGLTDAIMKMAARGQKQDAASYARNLDKVTELRWRVTDFFEEWDFIVTPTSAALPWPRSEPGPVEINGNPAGARASAIYTTFANIGGLPGISIPFGQSRAGLPIGMQIVGKPGSDYQLLHVAAQLELPLEWPSVSF